MKLDIIFNVSLFTAISVGLAACDRPSPEALRQRQHLPGPDFVADATDGEHLFHSICAKCHGHAGTGTTQGPPLVDKIYRPGHHADLTFHWAIKDGVKQHHWKFGDMPPVENLTPEQAGNIIAYIRSEQRKAGIQ